MASFIIFFVVVLFQGTNQNSVGNPMMNNSIQLVNMRPPTPTAQSQPRTVATVSPRVVISNQHMIAQHQQNSAVSSCPISHQMQKPQQQQQCVNNITFSVHNSSMGQQQIALSGQPSSALLLKTENGYRLLHVSTQSGQPTIPNSVGANQTIRIQTAPSVSRFTGPPLALRKTIVTQQPMKTKANININQILTFCV